jgi:hypothetical protein
MDKKLPSFLQMMTNYAVSSAKHIANGMKITTEEQYRNRLQACHSCPHLTEVYKRCSLCGCPVENKAYRVTDSCPDTPPRWEKLTIGEDGTPIKLKNAEGKDNNTETSNEVQSPS